MNFFEFKGFRIRIDIKLFDIKVSLLGGMKNRGKKQNKNLWYNNSSLSIELT